MRFLLALLATCILTTQCLAARPLKEDTAIVVPVGPFVDSAGAAVTAPTIASIDITAYKNDATTVTITPAASGTANDMVHTDDGYYSLELTATDTSTPGFLRLTFQISGSQIFHEDFEILPANIYDSQYGSDLQKVDATSVLDTTIATPATAGYFPSLVKDGTGTGEIDTNAGAIVAVTTVTTLTNLPTMPANWFTASGVADNSIDAGALATGAIGADEVAVGAFENDAFASGAITNDTLDDGTFDSRVVSSNAFTASAFDPDVGTEFATANWALATRTLTALPTWPSAYDAEIQSEVEDALVAHRLDELMNADSDIDGAAPPTVGSVMHELLTKTAGSFTYDQTTDSLEAIKDSGGGGATANDIAEALFTYDATATYATANAGSVVKQIADNGTGGSGLDAAGVRDAIGLASANLDTQLLAIDDFLDTEVAAIKAKTDLLVTFPANFTALGINASGHVSRVVLADTSTALGADAVNSFTVADGAFDAGTFQAGALTASGLAADAATEIATAVWALGTRTLTSLGTWPSAWDAEVQSEVEDALVVHRLDEILGADSDIDGAAPPVVGSLAHEMLTKTTGSFTYDQTTDSLEAIKDSGGGGATADDIAEALFTYDATATYATANAGSVVKQIADNGTGGSGLDAAGVRAAVGLASANLDTQLGVIDDFVDTEVLAIKAKTDLLVTFPANFTSLGINASGHVSRVTLVDISTAIGADAVNSFTVADNTFDAGAFQPGFLTAAGTAADYVTEVQAGLATAAGLTTVAGYVDTEVASVLTIANKVDTAMALNAGNYRFTAAALALAPTGSGGEGGLSPEQAEWLEAIHTTTIEQDLSANGSTNFQTFFNNGEALSTKTINNVTAPQNITIEHP